MVEIVHLNGTDGQILRVWLMDYLPSVLTLKAFVACIEDRPDTPCLKDMM